MKYKVIKDYPTSNGILYKNELVKEGKAPEHHHTVQWLEGCADKWAGCPAAFANSRGFDVYDPTSLANTPQIEDKSNAY